MSEQSHCITKILSKLSQFQHQKFLCNWEISNPGEGYPFLLLKGHKGLRWIVPNIHHSKVISVLRSWQPYGKMAGIKWRLLLLYLRWKLPLSLLPLVEIVYLTVKHDVNPKAASPEGIKIGFPIIYIGYPTSSQKAVVTLITDDQKHPQVVIKLALGRQAGFGIANEAHMLKNLEQVLGANRVPQALGVNHQHHYLVQAYIEGKLIKKHTSEALLGYLGALVYQHKTINFQDYLLPLLSKFDDRLAVFGVIKIKLLGQNAKRGNNNSLPAAVVHGDFVPWNILIRPSGKLFAVDWEAGQMVGLPLYDLLHFYFGFDMAFARKLSCIEFLANNKLVSAYCEKLGLLEQQKHQLAIYYFLYQLHHHCDDDNARESYLTKQITALLSAL